MKYFTTARFNVRDTYTSSYHHPWTPAVLFWDTERDLALEETLAAARAIYQLDMGESPCPAVARSEEFGGHKAWLLTTRMAVPPATHRAHEKPVLTFIRDLREDSMMTSTVDVGLELRSCTNLQALVGTCPCELASKFVGDYKYDEQRLTECAAQVVLPKLNVLSVAQIIQAAKHTDGLPDTEDLVRQAGEFSYLAPKMLTGKHFEKRFPHMNNMSYDEDAVQDMRDALSDAAVDAARTRKHKRTECVKCPFEGDCSHWVMDKCGGAKHSSDIVTSNDARTHQLMGGVDVLAAPGFTRSQRDALLRMPDSYTTYTAWASDISRHALNVKLGYFTRYGYRIYAAVGDKTRSQDFATWEALTTAVPDLRQAIFAVKAYKRPSRALMRAYRVANTRRYHPPLYRGYGYGRDRELVQMFIRNNKVYVYYENGPLRSFTGKPDDEHNLYNLTHHPGNGYLVQNLKKKKTL